ncbi:MAG: hypothetical protein QOJ95_4452 [Mycobacterium sp.]|jgi:hypothetical protein|nr:hypothetical protein [Mycobacterium sp.]
MPPTPIAVALEMVIEPDGVLTAVACHELSQNYCRSVSGSAARCGGASKVTSTLSNPLLR